MELLTNAAIVDGYACFPSSYLRGAAAFAPSGSEKLTVAGSVDSVESEATMGPLVTR